MFTRLAARTAVLSIAAALLTQTVGSADAAVDPDAPVLSGRSEYTAAGSCWEIKQRYPTAPSDRYWIVTPAMPAPQKIYCDQTTDGGGWALVGRGRERWTEAGGGTTGSGSWMTDLPIDGRNGAMVAKQLPGQQIDALLNNTRVDALADGIRLRRAENAAGTDWQELRFRYAKRDRWTWAFSAIHPVSSYTVDGTTTTAAQNSRDLRINGADDRRRVFTFDYVGNGYSRGFNYALGGPKGSTSPTSYLYSSRSDGGYATPFTQMYVRPKLLRGDMDFGSIGSGGLPAVTNKPIVSSQALPNTWGVKGLGAGGQNIDYATEVSAFAQIGNVMYVGGNFTTVRNNATGQEIAQPYLAAFDATTGAWISGFRPRLNNQVKALAVMGGRLVVGGQFTSVNGATRRALVTLSPTTGVTYTPFKTNFAQSTPGAQLWVRALEVSGSALYVGGGFTSVSGGSSTTARKVSNLVRLAGGDGAVQAWNPGLGVGLVQANGTRTLRTSVLSLDLSPDGKTLFAAGQFQRGYVGVSGKAQVSTPGAAAISTGTTATFRPWTPRYSSANAASRYQQTVTAVGDKVWLGGSQHSLVQYAASNLAFQRGALTLGGGDFQATASGSGVVYGSCHCDQLVYSDTLDYDNRDRLSGFTQGDRIGYVGAWDASTGALLPQFAPTSGTRSGEGPFALRVGADGTLWAGGDYTSVVTTNNKSEWAGGFVRFARTPSTAPAAPTDLTVYRNGNYGYLGWKASATSGVSYELLKDNRVIQSMAAGDLYSDSENYQLDRYTGRFFVRAVDAAGNRSATTPVTLAGGSTQAANRAVLQTPPDQAGSDEPAPGGPVTDGSEDPATAPTERISAEDTWQVTAPGEAGVAAGWSSRTFVPGSEWRSAAAPLGWGTDVAASSFDDRPGTFYVRRDVTIDDPSSIDTVTIRTVADDGAAVYVNGVEVGRKNLPGGKLDGSVSATATPTGSTSLDWTIEVPADLLVAGRNVVSAEVHPGAADTRDVVFALQLTTS